MSWLNDAENKRNQEEKDNKHFQQEQQNNKETLWKFNQPALKNMLYELARVWLGSNWLGQPKGRIYTFEREVYLDSGRTKNVNAVLRVGINVGPMFYAQLDLYVNYIFRFDQSPISHHFHGQSLDELKEKLAEAYSNGTFPKKE